MLPDCCKTSQTQATCSWVNPNDWKGMRAVGGQVNEDAREDEAIRAEDMWCPEEGPCSPRWWLERDEGIWEDSVICPMIILRRVVIEDDVCFNESWDVIRLPRRNDEVHLQIECHSIIKRLDNVTIESHWKTWLVAWEQQRQRRKTTFTVSFLTLSERLMMFLRLKQVKKKLFEEKKKNTYEETDSVSVFCFCGSDRWHTQ